MVFTKLVRQDRLMQQILPGTSSKTTYLAFGK